jgi:hypothetical protein
MRSPFNQEDRSPSKKQITVMSESRSMTQCYPAKLDVGSTFQAAPVIKEPLVSTSQRDDVDKTIHSNTPFIPN